MSRNWKHVVPFALAALICGSVPASFAAERERAEKLKKARGNAAAADTYDELYERYLQAARATPGSENRERDISWMTGLSNDHRARRVNDLVTIKVVESISATGSADSSLDKSSSGSASV